MLFLRVACLLAAMSGLVRGQTNAGKEFWVAELPNVDDYSLYPGFNFAILVSNPNDVSATVTISHISDPDVTFVVPPQGLVTQEFPPRAELDGIGVFTDMVYHVTSNVDIVATSFVPLQNDFSNDASLLYPVPALGKKHRVLSYMHPTNSLGSMFGVVAVEDGTSLQSFDLDGVLVDDVVLNRGEMYQRVTDTLMTGWSLVSDKDVSVFSGTRCTGVGDTGDYCDILYEQVIPEESLGSSYLACPTLTRPIDCIGSNCSPDVFQYVATEDGTTISFSNGVSPSVNLNAGESYSYQTNVPHAATSDKPVYATQILLSETAGFPVPGTGDPALSLIPLVSQFQFSYLFNTPGTFEFDFINVVAPVGTVLTSDGVTLDPISCDGSEAGVVDGVAYCCKGYPVTDGEHTITSSTAFGLTVSGFEEAASYAYLGGVGLEKINAGCNTGGPYLAGTCGIPFTLSLDGTFDCSDGSPPDVVWYSPDSADIFIQDFFVQDPTVTVYDYGVFSVEATVSCGVEAPVQCSTTVQVNEACLPGTRAPFYSTSDGPPSPSPTSKIENRDGGIIGEPHILRWNQESFDFHGECDLIMVQSDNVNDKPLDLHVRTTMDGSFSSITAMALRLGDTLIEVDPYSVHHNGETIKWEELPLQTEAFYVTRAYHINRPKRRAGEPQPIKRYMDIVLNDKSTIHVSRTMLENSLDLISITIDGSATDFDGSRGLLGDYRTGDALGRDGRNMNGDWNAYGMEWQVLDTEPKLFKDKDRAPQLPATQCKMPEFVMDSEMVLSLAKKYPQLYMKAMIACARAAESLNDCMEDVMLAKDVKAAETY